MRAVLALTLLASIGIFFEDGGTMTTAVGRGIKGYEGDGKQASLALLNQPFHCELDSQGRLLIAEADNHCVRAVDLSTGVIRTVAGTGKKGDSGDGGAATSATFNEPYAVVADAEHNLYIVDRLNAVIRKVDGKTQVVTTLAGNRTKGYSGDGGPANQASLREPNDCCLDGKGGLLIADVADWRIRRVDLKSGRIATFAGTGRPAGKPGRIAKGDGGKATEAILVGARAVCVDGKGNTYICEREGHALRRVDAQGLISTVAGTGTKGYSGDGGPALQATLNGPKAIRCDHQGNVLIVDTENHAIRKLDVVKGTITTVAGGRKGAGGDKGKATEAGLDRPHGCVADAQGVLYIADSNNHRVRRVAP